MMFSGAASAILFAAQIPAGNGLIAFLPLAIIMVIFYVLLILPAQRRQKKTQAMLGELKTGDKEVTTGGLYGTIAALDGDTVQLRIADHVKVKVARPTEAEAQSDRNEVILNPRKVDDWVAGS